MLERVEELPQPTVDWVDGGIAMLLPCVSTARDSCIYYACDCALVPRIPIPTQSDGTWSVTASMQIKKNMYKKHSQPELTMPKSDRKLERFHNQSTSRPTLPVFHSPNGISESRTQFNNTSPFLHSILTNTSHGDNYLPTQTSSDTLSIAAGLIYKL